MNKNKTLHLVGCGCRTVFGGKLFFRTQDDSEAGDEGGRVASKQKKKTLKTKSRTTQKLAPRGRARPSLLGCARARDAAVRNSETKSKGEITWEKTEYKPFFDSGNHIYFSKNDDFLPF